ncbi:MULTISPECIES: lipid II-degrading bacteriocin [Pseudomonas]|uniref:lipid II-degrading bacteriocin n=1 Tax=Pseudomonas TaxID=286 RepID=UPI0010D11A31|nr:MULTISPECIES: lipid II-degrading bacteriocin [Pseudomonas]MBD8597361.1 lipid II-degrading bacteriocin [Pseudomonas sp. CFBP 8772]RYE72827.1 MAG: lipid II-degrading bacteriocin [Oxalobacteraceae bacterium]
MPVEMPEMVIYAYPGPQTIYSTDGEWDNLFDGLPEYVREVEAIPLAAPALTLNGEAVWAAASAADAHKMMDEIAKGLSSQPVDMVRTQLGIHAYANYIWGENGPAVGKFGQALDGSLDLQYGYGQFLAANLINIDTIGTILGPHAVDFYGIPTMPFAALGYWIFGGGAPRYADVRSLDLAITVADLNPVKQILSDPAYQAGTYQITAEPFSYNTFNNVSDLPVALTVGRVSGNLTGALTINADGSYSFSGSYTLNDDKFDADPSNRPWLQEALTTFLMQMGETFGHADYVIHFQGAQSVNFTGVR